MIISPARRWQFAALVAGASMISTGLAFGQNYLSAAAATALLADGKPWLGERPDGERLKVTFNRDGTGRWEGPMMRATTWDVQGEAICIHLGFPFGTKCIRLRRDAGKLDGFDGGTLALVLSR